MSPLPRLRMDLDFMPSPVEDRPGLLIRDPFQYSDATLIVPPALVSCLEFFDGERSALDMREHLVRLTGELNVGEIADHLIGALEQAAFLHNETFERRKEDRHREFGAASHRYASHAGGAYPDDPGELRGMLGEFLAEETPPAGDNGNAPGQGKLIGIAAPHVSPMGGWESYRDAYRALTPDLADRTFVVLGTSHYGAPDRFGLTRKPFVTPFGEARTDAGLAEWIERQAPDNVVVEDYCHAVEHSIEFQVIFLQHLYGPDVRILPVLCGSYARSIYHGGLPEESDGVHRLFDSLGEIAAREGDRLFWILGVDMAHIGHRYGDRIEARANEGEMAEVAVRDRERIQRLEAGDSAGFWALVQQNQDDLRWCGSAPLYTFLRSVPGTSGSLRRYQHWNIDAQSVVSFAAMTFHRS